MQDRMGLHLPIKPNGNGSQMGEAHVCQILRVEKCRPNIHILAILRQANFPFQQRIAFSYVLLLNISHAPHLLDIPRLEIFQVIDEMDRFVSPSTLASDLPAKIHTKSLGDLTEGRELGHIEDEWRHP